MPGWHGLGVRSRPIGSVHLRCLVRIRRRVALVDEAAAPQSAVLLEDGMGDGRGMRGDALQVAGDVDMQRAGLDTLRIPPSHPFEMALDRRPLEIAHTLLLLQ